MAIKSDSAIQLRKRGEMTAVVIPRLEKEGTARLGFTTRGGGVSRAPFGGCNLSFEVGDADGAVVENRRWAARSLRLPFTAFTFCGQAHGDVIAVVERKDKGRGLYSSRDAFTGHDAMITNLPGISLCLLVADCLPLVIVDPVRGAIGIAHLGWKGTALNLCMKTVLKMGQEYATSAENCLAVLGPAICPQCYEVDDTVRKSFRDGEAFFKTVRPKHYSLDLAAANRAQLLKVGVKKENIIETHLCTAQYLDYFFSHRAEGAATGRQVAAVMLR